jgi:hypothetical protein
MPIVNIINKVEGNILKEQSVKLEKYLIDRKKYMCGTYLMEKIEYIFCDLFDAYTMKIAYDKRNKFILESFTLGLKICIGNYELLLENNINHNDLHDGNFGFTKGGVFKFIDFGMANLVTNIDKVKYKKIITEYNKNFFDEEKNELLIIKKYILFRELRYLKNMYYFEDESSQLEEFYEDKHYSPIKQILESLKKNEYKLGSYKKFANHRIDVVKIKKIMDAISDS